MYTNMLQWETDQELKSYFKSEYKRDFEYAYNNFLENRKSENRKSRLQFLKSFFKKQMLGLWWNFIFKILHSPLSNVNLEKNTF